MKNINITLIGVSLLALTFSFKVNAQSCAVVPTCETLGYDQISSDCSGKKSLKCPFDQTKFYCPDAGDAGADNCAVGDILYSDKSCNANIVSGKTPIGIVFSSDKKLAIALQTTTAYWSTTYIDIPDLTNYASSAEAVNDWEGKSNTSKVVAYCSANGYSCPAFDYVNTYKTEGTNTGDWYLPAMGELNAIYENKAVINMALSKIGVTSLPGSYHWSSTEESSQAAFPIGLHNGNIIWGEKNDYKMDVRPILAY